MKQRIINISKRLSVAEKTAICIFAVLTVVSTAVCGISTEKLSVAALFFLAVSASFAVFTALNVIRRKKFSKRIKTSALAVGTVLTLLIAVVFVSVYDFSINIVNLYQRPLIINGSNDILYALDNGYLNIAIELERESLFKTSFTYSQYIKEIVVSDDGSKDTNIKETVHLYDYYIFQFDGKFFSLRIPCENIDNYFEEYKEEQFKPISVIAPLKPDSDVLRALNREFYSYIYPEELFDGENQIDIDQPIIEDETENGSDNSAQEEYDNEEYLKVYGDLPEGDIVDTVCLIADDGNIDLKRTYIPFVVTVFPFGVVSLFIGIKKDEQKEAPERKKRYIPKRKRGSKKYSF